MRISLLTYSTRPRGGVVHTLNLAEALADEGADVRVHSLARGGDEGFFRPVDPAVTVELHPFPDVPDETVGRRILRSIEVLAASVDTAGDDVVHAQDCISANAVERCVRTVHHLDTFTTPELVACHERALRRPLAHVCVSAAVAGELRDGWGIEATVIPNGVEAERFAAAAADTPVAIAARDRWRSRIGSPFVLTVGGIEPRKGTIDLLDAMARVGRATPPGASGPVRLVIAGGETLFDYRPYREAFDRRCRELAVEPIVLGPVDHVELPALVAACDVFAFPSTREGFGLAPLEALAAGRPVVCRSLPVLREVFAGAVAFAASPVDLAASITVSLAEGPPPERVRAGRDLAARHRWSDAARRHLALYRALAHRPAG